MGLQAKPTNPLRVLVENGHKIECHHLYASVLVHVQGKLFFVDLHVLPLYGTYLVLGVRWLKSLGPILTDYNDLTMKFLYSGRLIELSRDTNSKLRSITLPQLCRLVCKNEANGFFHICIVSWELPSTQTVPSPSNIPKIASLINKFWVLFQTFPSLPPSKNYQS